MTRIRCRYLECVYLEGGICTLEEITLDPEDGCLNMETVEDLEVFEEEEEEEPLEEWEEDWEEEEEEDLWEEDEW